MAQLRSQGKKRTIDARPDTPDFRDRLYEATLVEVPPRRTLEEYFAEYPPNNGQPRVPVLDQGEEGACTGFGLAAVANYLLRRRRVQPDLEPVSPRMLYEMARRYDEWPGEDYSGSSARGAMKGWHKHGVCAFRLWPYDARHRLGTLTDTRARDASRRPLGAYYRVNHKDLICMHAALTEVGILYATASVHSGWQDVGADGIIKRTYDMIGGHAFAIVAYDADGFWIQNSWGPDWGRGGFCHITYDDWLANGSDVWVARLGVPIQLLTSEGTASARSLKADRFEGYSFQDLRPHIISLGNNGQLKSEGTYGTSIDDLKQIFEHDIPAATQNWKHKRILLYAHGGLVDEASAVQKVANFRSDLLDNEIYPVGFIWHSDFFSTLKYILEDAFRRRRPEGFFGKIKEFMEDRLDDALEPLARLIGGKAQWDEMKENANCATAEGGGGARLAAQSLARLVQRDPRYEIHIAGHSAGSIFHAPLLQLLASSGRIADGPMKGKEGLGLKIKTCTLWAPACTTELFKQAYAPLIQSSAIERFSLFTLTDTVERDDNCGGIYKKSLLYLVANAFESKPRIPLVREGTPILGMARYIRDDQAISNLLKRPNCSWILSPNSARFRTRDAARATSHGGFDDDQATLLATLSRILGVERIPERTGMPPLVANLRISELGKDVEPRPRRRVRERRAKRV